MRLAQHTMRTYVDGTEPIGQVIGVRESVQAVEVRQEGNITRDAPVMGHEQELVSALIRILCGVEPWFAFRRSSWWRVTASSACLPARYRH